MFEAWMPRVARAVERRAAERARRLAERLAGALPADVRVEAEDGDVRLGGRALRRRLALDPALKWTMTELIR